MVEDVVRRVGIREVPRVEAGLVNPPSIHDHPEASRMPKYHAILHGPHDSAAVP
jgi:hypothetical protein